MNTRIGTEYFVNKNAAMRYYSSQWQSSGVEAKIKEGAIKFGMPPRKDGYRIVLNNKEGRYFYEEVAPAVVQAPKPVEVLAQTPVVTDEELDRAKTMIETNQTPIDLDWQGTAKELPTQADELVPVPLINEGDPVPEFVKAAEGFCGFCMKPTDQCECKGVTEDEAGLKDETVAEPERTEGASPNLAAPYGTDKVIVKTNNVPRELLFFSELTEKERKELDYVKEDTNSFFRLKGQVYDAGEFVRIVHPGQDDPNPCVHRDESNSLPEWDGIHTTSYSTGVVIRYPRDEDGQIDPERVVIGTFYVGSGEVKDPRAENNVQNMDDGMTKEELMAFWTKHQGGRAFKDLFPSGGEGVKNATAALANYASNKATAMGLRIEGKIAKAQEYEAICDTIYKSLPDWARSW